VIVIIEWDSWQFIRMKIFYLKALDTGGVHAPSIWVQIVASVFLVGGGMGMGALHHLVTIDLEKLGFLMIGGLLIFF